jgi:hypothetical protein
MKITNSHGTILKLLDIESMFLNKKFNKVIIHIHFGKSINYNKKFKINKKLSKVKLLHL